MEYEGGFDHLHGLSHIYCLPIVRMAILSDGMWFLVVDLISIPPIIISNTEHLVL